MEEVVEEETRTVQTAAGLYTGYSALPATPEVLGQLSNIWQVISGLFFFLTKRDGLWQEGEYTAPEQKPVEQWLVWSRLWTPLPLQDS